MGTIVELNRKSVTENTRWDGIYRMYSEDEAQARGIEYLEWWEGIRDNKFKNGLGGPYCLVEETYVDNEVSGSRSLFLPRMVVPVFFIDYRPYLTAPVARTAIALSLATFRWLVYRRHNKRERNKYDPKPTAMWAKSSVRTQLDDFREGFKETDYLFVLGYMRELLLGLMPREATLKAFSGAYPFRPRKRGLTREQTAIRWLKNCLTYLDSGMADTDRLKDAFKRLNIDEDWVAGRLKIEAESKDNKYPERKQALDEIQEKMGIKDAADAQIGANPFGTVFVQAGAVQAPAGLLPVGQEAAVETRPARPVALNPVPTDETLSIQDSGPGAVEFGMGDDEGQGDGADLAGEQTTDLPGITAGS